MKNTIYQKLTVVLAVPALLAIGCKTVVRENIISAVETGVGVSLAENPKTEMYEAKIGFIRSQFYSVPTGKVVENDAGTNGVITDKRSNRADLTPELISGIRLNTSAKQLFLGADISENFAVGKIAVMSPAAVAMYVADAKNPEQAKQAAQAASAGLVYNTPETLKQRPVLDDLLNKKLKPEAACGGKTADKFTSTEEFADCLANEIAPGKTLGYLRLVGGKDLDTLITQLQSAVQP